MGNLIPSYWFDLILCLYLYKPFAADYDMGEYNVWLGIYWLIKLFRRCYLNPNIIRFSISVAPWKLPLLLLKVSYAPQIYWLHTMSLIAKLISIAIQPLQYDPFFFLLLQQVWYCFHQCTSEVGSWLDIKEFQSTILDILRSTHRKTNINWYPTSAVKHVAWYWCYPWSLNKSRSMKLTVPIKRQAS